MKNRLIIDVAETGTKRWYLNDQLHRTDGPAVEWSDGNKEWWLNGLRHRTDGPAIEWVNGAKMWFLNGKEVDPIVHFVRRKEFV